MKKFLIIFLIFGCLGIASAKDNKKEVYVWLCQYNRQPLFVNHDYKGMDAAAEELGVIVRRAGPLNVDLKAFKESIELEILKKPAGMMVVGWDASLAADIDKAIDAGIPVVTVDADVPGSKRISFIGTDWYQLGYEIGCASGKKLASKSGRAAMMGITAADNTVLAKKGFTDALKKYAPGIIVEPKVYESKTSSLKVAETISEMIQEKKDLILIAGFDSTTGPGIAKAIKDTGKTGQVWGACVDAELDHLLGVKNGQLIAAVGQKREFFTYYGVKILYDLNHSKINFSKEDKKFGISHAPAFISTGFIIATKDNVDSLLESVSGND